jgi:hypothetical protein
VAKQFDKLLAVFQKEMTGEIMRVLYEKYRSVPSKTTIDAVMVRAFLAHSMALSVLTHSHTVLDRSLGKTPALAPVREMFATQGIAFVFQDVDTDKDDQISLVRLAPPRTTRTYNTNS